MTVKSSVPRVLRDLMRAQAGAVSLTQCRLAGVSRSTVGRLVAEGHWVRAGHGLFVDHGGEWAPGTRQWLALLDAGAGAALGLGSAAAAQGWRRPPPEVVLVLPHERGRLTPSCQWRPVRTRVPFRTQGTPPMTTPARTALDLCRDEPDRVVAILTDVVNARRTTPQLLLQELEAFPSFPRRSFVRGVLGDVGEGALSVLEAMWLKDVERAHGLPRGERQSTSRAGLRDIRYGPLLVELDGRLGHEGSGAFRDMDRDNIHVLQGEPTLRFGFHDVDRRPCAAAAMVATALRRWGCAVDSISCRRGCREHEALLDSAA